MPGALAIPNVFLGNSPSAISKLDADLSTIASYINAREVTIGLLANRPAAGNAGAWFLATDVAGGALYVDNGAVWTQASTGSATGAPGIPTGATDGAVAVPRLITTVDGTLAAPLTGQTFLTPSVYTERWEATVAGTVNSILTARIDTIFQGAFTAQAPAFGGSLLTRAFAVAAPAAGINQIASLNGYAYMTATATKSVIWGIVGVAQINVGAPIATTGANACELDVVNNAANPGAAETPGGTNQSAVYGLFINSVGTFQVTTAISIHASTLGGGANAWQQGIYISGIVTGNPYIKIDSGVASGGRITLASAGFNPKHLNNESGAFRVFNDTIVVLGASDTGILKMGTRNVPAGGATATLGLTGGANSPTGPTQNSWITCTDLAGITYFLPAWI